MLLKFHYGALRVFTQALLCLMKNDCLKVCLIAALFIMPSCQHRPFVN